MENMEFTVRITQKKFLFKTFIKEESNIKDINNFVYKYIDKNYKLITPCDFTKLNIGEKRILIFSLLAPVRSIRSKDEIFINIIRTK